MRRVLSFRMGLSSTVPILRWVLESHRGPPDFRLDIPVARRELIAKDMEERKIDLVGAVRIRGMDVRLDVGGIVEQEIEHIVALMFVGADDLGIDRDMIGHQGVGHDAFFEAEILRRMAGIDRGDARFELLAVTTGMQAAIEIIVPEDGERREGITDPVIGRAQRLQTEEILGGGQQRGVADIRNLAHFTQPRIGPPGEQTGDEGARVHRLFDVAPQEVLEGLQEVALPMDEMQHATDLDLAELLKEGMVHGLLATGILQGPVDLAAAAGELEMRVLAGGNPLIDHGKAVFQLLFQGGQVLLDGLRQDGEPRLRQQPVFLLPLLIIEQVVLETPEAQTLAAEDIARFQAVAQEPIDQKLIAVGAQAFVALGIGAIQIPFEGLRDAADGELLRRVVAQRFAPLQRRREKLDRFEQRDGARRTRRTRPPGARGGDAV